MKKVRLYIAAAHADVAHPAGPVGELVGLVVVAAEQLHQQRARRR